MHEKCGFNIIIVNNSSRNKCALLGENEEDYSSISSSSSSSEDSNAEKLAFKEIKIAMNKGLKDSISEQGNIFEGKPSCSKYIMPTNDENTLDSLLTDAIIHKK